MGRREITPAFLYLPRDSRFASRRYAPGTPYGSWRWNAYAKLAALPHPLGDDADAVDAGAPGGVDHAHNGPVRQRCCTGDEHRLVGAGGVDRSQAAFELLERDVLMVDADSAVGCILEDDLFGSRDGLLRLRRQLTI